MTYEEHETIRWIAHRLWEQEGRPAGRELDHWTRAEAIVREAREGAHAAGGVDALIHPQPLVSLVACFGPMVRRVA